MNWCSIGLASSPSDCGFGFVFQNLKQKKGDPVSNYFCIRKRPVKVKTAGVALALCWVQGKVPECNGISMILTTHRQQVLIGLTKYGC